MHQFAVATWVHDVQQSQESQSPQPSPFRRTKRRTPPDTISLPRPKTRRLALTNASAYILNMGHPPLPDSKRDQADSGDRPTRRLSPRKRQSPLINDDANDSNAKGSTPQIENILSSRPIPVLRSKSARTLVDIPTASSSQSRTKTKDSSGRSISPKKSSGKVVLGRVGNGVRHLPLANRPTDVDSQLGHAGKGLWDALRDCEFGNCVLPAEIKVQLAEQLGKMMELWLDEDDHRSIPTLLCELETVQTINAKSNRCVTERDHEAEWNCRVHTPLLELALGYVDDKCLGFRNVYVFNSPLILSRSNLRHQYIRTHQR